MTAEEAVSYATGSPATRLATWPSPGYPAPRGHR